MAYAYERCTIACHFFSLGLAVGPEADDCGKVCKCVSDSRDVSSIVANTEVSLKVHGFVRGAELRNEGGDTVSAEPTVKKLTIFSLNVNYKHLQWTDASFRRGWWLYFGAPVVWKASYDVWNNCKGKILEKLCSLLTATQNCTCVIVNFKATLQ